MSAIKSPKKLIEVALPLDDINAACEYEKKPGIGAHPRGLHLWWARRPLAAARAVIFAQMVNDPGYQQGGGFKFGVNKEQAAIKRAKLFDIIRDLVKWENTNNEAVLQRARDAIWESWRETCELNKNHPQAKELFNPEVLPAFHDPFAGGGALPLEAQRLGLESYASDLNPVAVMINKAMIEIPPKFYGMSPVGPIPKGEKQLNLNQEWHGIEGLAEDVRRYGYWMKEKAFERIGHLYPKIKITANMATEREDLTSYVGQELTVIAWLWARTVKSPNPMYSHVDVPLVRSFVLSSKNDKEAWVETVITEDGYDFVVRRGKPTEVAEKGTVGRTGGTCILSNTAMPLNYIRTEGQQGRMGKRLMAIVAEGKKGRVYLSPTQEMVEIADSVEPEWQPNNSIEGKGQANVGNYGFKEFSDLFTKRQLIALTTFSDLIEEVREKIIIDSISSGMLNDEIKLSQNGKGATAYADSICIFLGFVIDRCADFNNAFTGWRSGNEKIMYLFARQAIPMVWDFGEANILANVVGGFETNLDYQTKCILKLANSSKPGYAYQNDAVTQDISLNKVISTDPPYYDNISYADLSDFFYGWMRRSLRPIYPSLFGTMAVPKDQELVATPYRHGNKQNAEQFFLQGMTKAMQQMANQSHPAFPVSIYYAFKQSETRDDSTVNTGWETFLQAVLDAGFSIDGTWPVRSEQTSRMIGADANALASSVVLVCRRRDPQAPTITRRELQRELREQMPEALEAMISGSDNVAAIAPVDLAQAAIGPGMAIFSRYSDVLEADGRAMTVHDALILINRAISDYLNPDSGNFDADTLFCSDWFSQYGWSIGAFGEADTLARAKGTSVEHAKNAGVLESSGGKVQLRKWMDYPKDWDPKTDNNMPIWEACHHIIRALNQQGESAAGELLARMPENGESIRRLAYHLYTQCERKKWATEARAYNELLDSWHEIVAASYDAGHKNEQIDLEL